MNETIEYKLHALNEFSSDRKRMSVLVELPNGITLAILFIFLSFFSPSFSLSFFFSPVSLSSLPYFLGNYRLYVKGADSAIEILLAANQPNIEVTKGHLNEFANEGLRTLLLAYRDIPADEFQTWMKSYTEVLHFFAGYFVYHTNRN